MAVKNTILLQFGDTALICAKESVLPTTSFALPMQRSTQDKKKKGGGAGRNNILVLL